MSDRFHIVSVGRNTERFATAHFASTLHQDFPDYSVTWVDDASDSIKWGRTGEDTRDFTCILNSLRKGGLANTLAVVRAMQPDDVAVLCSADDELAHPNVLTRVKQEYDAGALLTYGQFVMSTGEPGWCRQLTEDEHRHPYDAPWVTSHLITFRAYLMQMIPDDLLRDADGNYYDFAGDQAFMLCMLAQVPYDRARFIPDVLLKYNRHEGNDPADKAARAEERIRDVGRRWLRMCGEDE